MIIKNFMKNGVVYDYYVNTAVEFQEVLAVCEKGAKIFFDEA